MIGPSNRVPSTCDANRNSARLHRAWPGDLGRPVTRLAPSLTAAIEQAREADILALAERLGSKLKRAGASEYVGPCPVCGGKDRFGVNIKKQVWNCRGCGKGGDVIGLAQHAGGATFAEAVAALSGETRPVSNLRRESAIPMPRTMTSVDGARRRGGCGLRDSRWRALSRKRTSGRRAATEGRYRPR